MIDFLKSFLLGIVEGITEWLPVSSTGHLILVKELIGGRGFMSDASFFDLYLYVIQFGAILAVATMYFKKLNPFAFSKTKAEKNDTWQMWFKVVIACLPAAVIGLLFDDYMEMIENWAVVSAMLIIYGVAFILSERVKITQPTADMKTMTYKTALLIGAFQVLSIVPGTSRSGATILGAIILGCSREVATEFSFFLAIPVMVGVSILKIGKFIIEGAVMTPQYLAVLLVGMAVSYMVSMFAIKFLTDYVRKHDFKVFGYYRIILGIVVIAFFTIINR